MPRNNIITGLDIGTSSIKILAAAKKQGSSTLEFLGKAQVPSFGVRRSVVVGTDEVSRRIADGIVQLQEEIGQKIEGVYINAGGSHISAMPSHGTVVVSRADQRISEEDKNRVIQAAQTFPLPSNKEILDIFPREFVVDNQKNIKDPLGMHGLRLEVDVLAVCAFSPFLKNLTAAVLNAGFQVSDITTSVIASSRAVLTPQQKELGVCLLDIGAGTTDMAICEEGDLTHLAIFPLGSERISHDLAVGLKTDIEIAEQIKKEFGSCILTGADQKERIDLPQGNGNGEPIIFSRKMLVKIIEARVSEIFDLVRLEIKKVSIKDSLPAGVVLTGGGAKLPKIVEIARKELNLPSRIGFPKGIDCLEEDPVWSAAAGLVLAGSELENSSDLITPFIDKGLTDKIKRAIKVFIP